MVSGDIVKLVCVCLLFLRFRVVFGDKYDENIALSTGNQAQFEFRQAGPMRYYMAMTCTSHYVTIVFDCDMVKAFSVWDSCHHYTSSNGL